ncbi:hypothetical protein BD413DRAFT_110849 [Trametes elegans]|nr:hypothetical protein BD413DRAFT_110849 [Trametes elegans]
MQASAMSSERYIAFPNDYSPVAYEVESSVDPYTPTVFDYSSGQWTLNHPYLEPADYPTLHGCATHHTPIEHGSIPLHAPVPVSGYSTLLLPTYDTHVAEVPYTVERFGPVEEPKPPTQDDGNPLEVYSKAPQVLFPTPSELLTDLNSRERGARNDGDSPDTSPSKLALGRTFTRAKVELCDEPPENLNQRKAYFRAVSDNVGFTVTDPDTITSHDKKRCYLECLEEYVQWLHEKIRLVGQEPLPLERVSSHRGLKSRSIRTMLVHKQDDISELNQRKLQEEQKFMDLQNAVLMRQATEESVQYRRHLVAMSAVPDMVPDYIQETR